MKMLPIRTAPSIERSQDQIKSVTAAQDIQNITKDLTWIDMLKGIAIIGVFFDNWMGYFLNHLNTQDPAFFLTTILKTAVGPFVQVFFILSGFGLTFAYLKNSTTNWSWKRWGWRRITKIIFPYYVFVILSFLLGMIGSLLYESVDVQFSWISLVTYLTFTRNFYPPSWGWNPPLWYMPVIIGLYIMFPILLMVLRKWGPVKLLLISVLLTYTSLIIAAAAGAIGAHASDLFLFWIVQFSIGMVLAYIRVNHADKLRLLIGFRAFMVGGALIFFSWILRTYIPYGKVFNDSVTSIGIFLILLNLGWGLRKIMPSLNNVFISLSEQSFYMYLIHYPVMKFLIGPLFPNGIHPVMILFLGGLFILVIYYLSSFLSKPIDHISSKLFAMLKTTSA